MNEQEAQTFDAQKFKQILMQRVTTIMPKTQEEAEAFNSSAKLNGVKQTVHQQVQQEQNKASNGIDKTTKTKPDENSVKGKEVTPFPQDKHPKIQEIAADKAMPAALNEEEVEKPMQQDAERLNAKFQEQGIEESQLLNSKEPSFEQALSQKQTIDLQAEKQGQLFRNEETNILNAAKKDAKNNTSKGLEQLQQNRKTSFTTIRKSQETEATNDNKVRTLISEEMNKIFDATKNKVESRLNALDQCVEKLFNEAAQRAKRLMENHIERNLTAYKEKRYELGMGTLRWIKDSVVGLPDEVNAFFEQGRSLYLKEMEQAIGQIAQIVATELNLAKADIALGKKDIDKYIKTLPNNLQKIAQTLIADIKAKFDSLEQNLEEKQNSLIEQLSKRYTETLKEVDERLAKLKAEQKGLIDSAMTIASEVIDTIKNLRHTLVEVLGTAQQAIQAVLQDPIGFLNQLIKGIGDGLSSFTANLETHLKNGLMTWLTGSLSQVGIKLPQDIFSLEGIFSLTTQVLGLSWDNIKTKAVKLLGEKTVSNLEAGFELFQIIKNDGLAGVWSYVKDQFADLQNQVMQSIIDLIREEVLVAGLKWIIGLLTPAGAFVKAVMTVVDLAKFFINRGKALLDLVKAFAESVKAIASGSVDKVATFIEQALAKSVPVLIDFLASLLGLNGLTEKVQKIFETVRTRVDEAIDGLIQKAQTWYADRKNKKNAKTAAKNQKKQAAQDKRTPQEQKIAFEQAMKEGLALLQSENKTDKELLTELEQIKAKYQVEELSGLVLKQQAETHTWLLKARLGEHQATQQIERQPSKATNEAEVNEEDRAKHEAIAKEIEAKLQAIQAKPSEAFADFYAHIKTEAAKLQALYQPQLREGIVLNIELINPVQEDEKDGDVDVRVWIRPNETEVIVSSNYDGSLNPKREPTIALNKSSRQVTAFDPAADQNHNMVGLATFSKNTITFAVYPKNVTKNGVHFSDDERMRGGIIMKSLIEGMKQVLADLEKEMLAVLLPDYTVSEIKDELVIEYAAGVWGGDSDNLNEFNAAYKKGYSKEDAARKTFTGYMAGKIFEFENVSDFEVVPDFDDPDEETRRREGFTKVHCKFHK